MQTSVKEDRDKFIGGSDIPIIMNLSHFKTRWELLQQKAGLIEDDFKGNDYTDYGNIMEEYIRDYINREYNKRYREGKHIIGDIRIHTDGECNDSILEIKTTSVIHKRVNTYKYYLVQLLFYMYNENKEKGMLAVYERPKDFDVNFNPNRLYVYMIDIDNYKELVEEIKKEVERFREDLQKVKDNPFLTEDEL